MKRHLAFLKSKTQIERCGKQFNFEIVEAGPANRIVIPELDKTWGYAIAGDSLRIWDPFPISPKKQRPLKLNEGYCIKTAKHET